MLTELKLQMQMQVERVVRHGCAQEDTISQFSLIKTEEEKKEPQLAIP